MCENRPAEETPRQAGKQAALGMAYEKSDLYAELASEKWGASIKTTAVHPGSFLRGEAARRRRDADALEGLANLMDGAERMGSNMPVLFQAVLALCNSK
jgi:hypothetical protein